MNRKGIEPILAAIGGLFAVIILASILPQILSGINNTQELQTCKNNLDTYSTQLQQLQSQMVGIQSSLEKCRDDTTSLKANLTNCQSKLDTERNKTKEIETNLTKCLEDLEKERSKLSVGLPPIFFTPNFIFATTAVFFSFFIPFSIGLFKVKFKREWLNLLFFLLFSGISATITYFIFTIKF